MFTECRVPCFISVRINFHCINVNAVSIFNIKRHFVTLSVLRKQGLARPPPSMAKVTISPRRHFCYTRR